jgi:hypothetical protein
VLGIASLAAKNLAVLVIGPPPREDDWTGYVRTIESLNQSVKPGHRPVVIQILKEGMGVPSPLQRKQLGELRGRINRMAVNAVVSDSHFVRLTQTALDWIRKPPYISSSHANFPAAHRWAESVVGHPIPELTALRIEAERAAARPDSTEAASSG